MSSLLSTGARAILYPVLFIGSLLATTNLGDIWERQANPIPGVQVMLRGGAHVSGTLSREWSGQYSLALADGRVLVFTMDQVLSMAFPARLGKKADAADFPPTSEERATQAANSSSSLDWSRWRAYLPTYLTLALLVAAVFLLDRAWLRRLLVLDGARNG